MSNSCSQLVPVRWLVVNRFQRFIFSLLVIVGIALTFAFGLWWFSYTHVPQNFGGFFHIFDLLIFALLSYIVWFQIATEIMLWMIADKIKKPVCEAPIAGRKVAFITTFVPGTESHDLLHKILPSLRQVDYEHDTWLLDEGDDPVAKEICAMYGVYYFTRKGIPAYNTPTGKFAARTKGGNHNAWYDAHGHVYDIVAQIDTDFIPRKDFLMRTLGYFNDPNIGWVTTPQIYGNESESFVAKGAAQQQFTFYGPVLQGLYGQDMALMLGANHIVRVDALKGIDYYGGHLTEDLLTGMTLHSKRWKSVYVPEALAIGEGPSTWIAYFNQQMRWAFGCIDILFSHSPKLLTRMVRQHKAYYLMMMQHYFGGLAMMMGVLLITAYFVFGVSASSMEITGMLLLYVPLIIWQFLVALWLQRFNVRPKHEKGLLITGKLLAVAVWPIYFLALVGVIRGQQLKFKVTPKGNGAQANDTPLQVFMPHIFIGVATLAAFIGSFMTDFQNPVMIFWALTTMTFMFGLTLGSQTPAIRAWFKRELRTWKRRNSYVLYERNSVD